MENNTNIYHGGGPNRNGFSTGGGGGGGLLSKWVTLPFTYSPDINVVVPVQSPANGAWSATRQGYFLGLAYSLREIHVLYNDYLTLSAGLTASFQIRRILADGSVPASSTVYTLVTTFPQSGAPGGNFFGDAALNLNIVLPNGYNYYGSMSADTTDDLDGISAYIVLERNLEQ